MRVRERDDRQDKYFYGNDLDSVYTYYKFSAQYNGVHTKYSIWTGTVAA